MCGSQKAGSYDNVMVSQAVMRRNHDLEVQ